MTPQSALAAALGGRILGPNHIAVGPHLVQTRLASVLVDGVRVGQWNDPTHELAERIRSRINGAAVTLYAADEAEVAS